MMNISRSSLLLLLGTIALVDGRNYPDQEICTSPNNIFTVIVDLYASELGKTQARKRLLPWQCCGPNCRADRLHPNFCFSPRCARCQVISRLRNVAI